MESKQTTQVDQVDFKTLILIGTASIVNRKRYNPISEVQIVRFPINPLSFQEDEDRFKLINRLLFKIQDIEDDKQLQKQMTGSTFYAQSVIEKRNGSALTDYLIFKPIKDNQLIHNAPPTVAYSKSYNIETSELLYKIF